MRKDRSDRVGPHRKTFEDAKKIILATESVCYLCGKPVDKSLMDNPKENMYSPLYPVVDHVIPLDREGQGYDAAYLNSVDNLHLTHRACNRAKGTRLLKDREHKQGSEFISNRILPQHNKWETYRAALEEGTKTPKIKY